jgi:hypothetical protein
MHSMKVVKIYCLLNYNTPFITIFIAIIQYDQKLWQERLQLNNCPQKSTFLFSLDTVADHSLETVLLPNSLRNW